MAEATITTVPVPLIPASPAPAAPAKEFSKDELDAAVAAAIAKRDSDIKAAAEQAALKAKGEYEALYAAEKSKLAKIESDLAAEKLARIREQIATAHKLPPELADRLRGDDKASIEKDAVILARLAKPAAEGIPAGGRGNGVGGESLFEMRRKAHERDPQYAGM